MEQIQQYIKENKERFLEELFEFIRIPSVSADASYSADVVRASEFLKEKLLGAGVDTVQIFSTPGFPLVYAEKIIDKNLPTILVYGHYDVQPAHVEDGWTTNPFEPVIKDEKIFARGAVDDKGQLFMQIKAFEFLNRKNLLSCNVKFLCEGEEEIGSKNLENFVREKKELLSADVAFVSDTDMIANDVPAITTGLRGLSYLEVEVIGPNKDIHSGQYGGMVDNPINVLTKMLASLKDENGHLTIPGFYDDVLEVGEEERAKLAEVAKYAVNESELKDSLGVGDLVEEKGYSKYESITIRPTFDICGISGGYEGEGAKTIIPHKAKAKISFRLVPYQNPEKIANLICKHLQVIAPKTVTVKTYIHSGGFSSVVPMDSLEYRAASRALLQTFGREPLPLKCGGSIPVVATFQEVLGIQTVLLGFGLESDNAHSPNESFGLYNFYKGIETIPWFYKYYVEEKKKV